MVNKRIKRVASGEKVDVKTGELVDDDRVVTGSQENNSKKGDVIEDYERHLSKVRHLKSMTETPAWQSFYAGVQRRIRGYEKMVLGAEKTRDIIRCQEAIKGLREVFEEIKKPVEEMMNLVSSYPLFAPSMKTRAEWNESVGRVTVVEN